MKLTENDLKLINMLCENARTPSKSIAEALGIAPSTVAERIRKLEDAGVIQGYRMDVDLSKLGRHLDVVIFVQLAHHTQDAIDSLMGSLITEREVLRIDHTGGESDLVIHVSVIDTKHLRDWIFARLTNNQEVKNVRTSVLFGSLKQTRV